jgi:hypothetical protein
MTDDFDWEQLLEGIRRDSVIPVVGKDLLQNFGTRVTILAEGDPIAFVDELHSRYKAAGIVSEDRPLAATDAGIQPPEVFLSYASENREAAFTARDILEKRGLSVWVDKAKGTYHRLSSSNLIRKSSQCYRSKPKTKCRIRSSRLFSLSS